MQLEWGPRPYLELFDDYWIPYAQGAKCLQHMGDLFFSSGSVRNQGLLVYGPSNSGKTMLVKKFKRDIDKMTLEVDPQNTTSKIQFVETPPDRPTPKALYREILSGINAPANLRDSSEKLLAQVCHLFLKNGVKMLIVDELHNISTASSSDQTAFLNVLKYLSNQLKISVIAVGTEEAHRILQLDQQLGSRIPPFQLSSWSAKDTGYALFIIQLLNIAGFPISEKKLTQKFIEVVHDLSEGLTGETKDLIMKAAFIAKSENINKIDTELLMKLNWTPPRLRYG